MDKERKRIIFVFGLILALAVFWVGYIVYSRFIDFGTIRVNAREPFSVEVVGSEVHNCVNSPCEIKAKSGVQDLLLTKEGYESDFRSIRIGLWDTTELNIDFQIEPYLTETDKFPEVKEHATYEISFNEGKNMYQLTRNGEEEALVYFPNKITSKQIYGSDSGALIIAEEGIYRVNLKEKSREKLSTLSQKIAGGKWSKSGKYFVFTENNAEDLYLLDEKNEVRKLGLMTSLDLISMTFDDSFVFATKQNISPESGGGKYDNYVSLLAAKNDYYSFGFYHPDENTYSLVDSYSEITLPPVNITPLGSGSEIYFQQEEKFYKIVLQKF